MSGDDQWLTDRMREELEGAEALLYFTVVDACPGDHQAKRRWEGSEAWCGLCGRTDRGELIKEIL